MKKLIFSFLLVSLSFEGTVEQQEVVVHSDLEGAKELNQQVDELRGSLRKQFNRGAELVRQGAEDGEYAALLNGIRSLRGKIQELEEKWRAISIQEGGGADEPYALWDVGETTLSQLIMEYGASDYLYIIPPELSGMKMSLFSSIPLPREAWDEMIEVILSHNGVGIRKLNAFVKQLYILKLDPSAIEGIVSREEDLPLFPSYARLCYVFSPPPEQMKSAQAFFERFSDPKQTTLHVIGTKVAIVTNRETIEKLMGLYRAVWENDQGKVIRVVNLSKVQPQEAERVLRAVFSEANSKGKPAFYPSAADELATLVLPQGLVLIGESETVNRAEGILTELESQLEDPSEKVIFWYPCKHSKPEDVASVLEQIYDSLIGSSFEKKSELPTAPQPLPVQPQEPNPMQVFPDRSTAFNPVLPANPPFVQPGVIDKGPKPTFGHFVVDPKTTSILMVVRREELSKIKAILKKLDTPKKMVQLDVLLVEKKLHDRKQIGIDLLRFGTAASHREVNSMTFETEEKSLHKGLLNFLFSRKGKQGPPVDLTYSFLLAQDDVRINANPSVLAVNQTPATVSITEEISINNGAIQLETNGGLTIEQSYTRAQYGITIVLTPTIHLAEDSEDGEEKGRVSLVTNLEFDTTQIATNDRPPVTRRHIENEVCVADGETIILGGLRRKIEEDRREKIPFLGDLPGVGKLFGATKTSEQSTEMFIFITPRIIHNGVEDLRRLRQAEYYKRAGDIPEFLEILDEAKKKERASLFNNTMQMLFDMY